MKYIAISPEGVEYRLDSLEPFCSQRGLSYQGMARVAYYKADNHKGWLCFLQDDKEVIERDYRQTSLKAKRKDAWNA